MQPKPPIFDEMLDENGAARPAYHDYHKWFESQDARQLRAKSVEADLVDRMGELESAALRNLLKQAILATDPGLPKLWQAPASAA